MKKIILVLSNLFFGYVTAQDCAGTMGEMTLKNITVTNNNTLEYDVYIKNIGTSTARLGGINGNVVYTPGLFSGTATVTFSIIEQPNSPSCSFPTLATITNVVHTAASQQLRYTQTIQNAASGNTVDMPANTDMKFARFRVTSSEPFALSTVTLRLPNGEDGPSITRNIGTLYCNGNTSSTNFAGTKGTMQVGGPFVVNLQTLSNEGFDKESLTVAPNPSQGVFEIYANEDVSVEAFNVLGERIHQENKKEKRMIIDLSSFTNGVYFLKVKNSKNQERVVKLVKQ